jgi:hypothetical protein
MAQYRNNRDLISMIVDAIGESWYMDFAHIGATQSDLIKLINVLKTEQNLRKMILGGGGWRVFPAACAVVGVLELEDFLDDIVSVWAEAQNRFCTEAAIFAILKTGGDETLNYLVDMLDKSNSYNGHYKSENDENINNAIGYISNSEKSLFNPYWHTYANIPSNIGKLS